MGPDNRILLEKMSYIMRTYENERSGGPVSDGVPMYFSGNQLPPSMANIFFEIFKKKGPLEQIQSSHIMPPVAKDKQFGSNTEKKITSLDSNTLN